jgi:hypothetical protein
MEVAEGRLGRQNPAQDDLLLSALVGGRVIAPLGRSWVGGTEAAFQALEEGMSLDLKALLTPEKGLIFRITHIDNVSWILDHGVHCRNSQVRDPSFRDIGNPDLIAKRARRVVPLGPQGTLSDYIACS